MESEEARRVCLDIDVDAVAQGEAIVGVRSFQKM